MKLSSRNTCLPMSAFALWLSAAGVMVSVGLQAWSAAAWSAAVILALIVDGARTRRHAEHNHRQYQLTEAALRASEKRFRALFDNANDLIYTHDLDGNFTSLNKVGEAMTGYTQAEAVQMNIKDVLRDPEQFRLAYHNTRRGGDVSEATVYEIDITTKQGAPLALELSTRLIYDGAIPVAVQGIARNITHRKAVERELRATNQRLQFHVENSPVGLIEWNADLKVLNWSKEAERIFGWRADEVLGKRIGVDFKFLHENDESSVMAEAVNHLLNGDVRRNHFHNRNYTKQGAVVHCEWYNSALYDDAGNLISVMSLALDVTERKQAERLRRESERRFRAFMNNSPAVAYMKDGAGRFVYINKPFERFLGKTKAEVKGKTSRELFGDYAVSIEANDCTVLEQQRVFEAVETVPTPDGTLEHWLNFKFPFVGGDGEVYVAGIGVDVTKRRQIELELERARDTALQSARLKSEFLANISHEIRTPLNGVIGMSSLLLETALDDEQREYTEIINRSSDALLRIINDILDFSKIEAGKLNFEVIDFDLRAVVEDTLELFAQRAQAKGIELASLIEANVAVKLKGDPGRLRQVLVNLIGNAVKFTERGEVFVRVVGEHEADNETKVRFEVSDTGIGIDSDAAAKIFEPFVQADGSTTRRFGGTGLGLAIARELIEMMQGEISVESQLQHGTTFRFTARFAKQSPAAPNSFPVTDTHASLEHRRVLIVDDNRMNRQVLLHQTTAWKMKPTAVENTAHALAEMRAAASRGEAFELLITDLAMPGTSGFDFARQVKTDADLRFTKIVVLPSFGQRKHGETARDIGVDGYLTKPVRQENLRELLLSVMSHDTATQLVTRHTLRESRLIEPVAQSPQTSLQTSSLQPSSTFITTIEPDGFTETSARRGAVLVVEDSPVNRMLAARQLERLGITAHFADNGLTALERLTRERFDLILMDCQMPHLDGFETTRRFRLLEAERELARTPIIAMTASARDADRRACLQAGMDDYLSKPTRFDELQARLAHWLAAPAQLALITSRELANSHPALNQLHPPVHTPRYENSNTRNAARSVAVRDACCNPSVHPVRQIAVSTFAPETPRSQASITGRSPQTKLTPPHPHEHHLAPDNPLHEKDFTAFDTAVIESYRTLETDAACSFVVDIINLFLDVCPQKLAALDAGLESQDTAATTAATHALRGSAASLGAHGIAEACAQIESFAQLKDFPRAAETFAKLQAAWSRVESRLTALKRDPANRN